MYKKILWTVALAFSLVLSQATFAHCGDGMKKMLESIQLDDAQKAKIKPIMMQLKSSMVDSKNQMRDISMQIKQQVESATMDQNTVNGMIDKKAAIIGNMMKAKVTAKNQILMILNAQQKTQMHNMMEQEEAKMAAKWKDCHDED